MAVRPCNAWQIYVGTELGVFASEFGGETWEPVNDGLAHTIVEALDFKDDDTLVAFTHGRGAFTAELGSCAGPGIPTLSAWGLTWMLLLVITAGAVIFTRTRNPAVE